MKAIFGAATALAVALSAGCAVVPAGPVVAVPPRPVVYGPGAYGPGVYGPAAVVPAPVVVTPGPGYRPYPRYWRYRRYGW